MANTVIKRTFSAHGGISIKLFVVYLHIINECLSYRFHPYSILTGHTKVESVAYQVLRDKLVVPRCLEKSKSSQESQKVKKDPKRVRHLQCKAIVAKGEQYTIKPHGSLKKVNEDQCNRNQKRCRRIMQTNKTKNSSTYCIQGVPHLRGFPYCGSHYRNFLAYVHPSGGFLRLQGTLYSPTNVK